MSAFILQALVFSTLMSRILILENGIYPPQPFMPIRAAIVEADRCTVYLIYISDIEHSSIMAKTRHYRDGVINIQNIRESIKSPDRRRFNPYDPLVTISLLSREGALTVQEPVVPEEKLSDLGRNAEDLLNERGGSFRKGIKFDSPARPEQIDLFFQTLDLFYRHHENDYILSDQFINVMSLRIRMYLNFKNEILPDYYLNRAFTSSEFLPPFNLVKPPVAPRYNYQLYFDPAPERWRPLVDWAAFDLGAISTNDTEKRRMTTALKFLYMYGTSEKRRYIRVRTNGNFVSEELINYGSNEFQREALDFYGLADAQFSPGAAPEAKEAVNE